MKGLGFYIWNFSYQNFLSSKFLTRWSVGLWGLLTPLVCYYILNTVFIQTCLQSLYRHVRSSRHFLQALCKGFVNALALTPPQYTRSQIPSDSVHAG